MVQSNLRVDTPAFPASPRARPKADPTEGPPEEWFVGAHFHVCPSVSCFVLVLYFFMSIFSWDPLFLPELGHDFLCVPPYVGDQHR